MRLLRSACIALSMYTRLPVPQFPWKDEDMQYAICFFPLAGFLVGAAVYGWIWASERLGISSAARCILASVLPLLLTGGIHADGFMDTSDALQSWGSREERLEILKDPHIGAFAVIRFLCLAGIWLSAVFCLKENACLPWAFSFVYSRALSGFAAVQWKKAKTEGSLNRFSAEGAEAKAAPALLAEILAGAVLMIKAGPVPGVSAAAAGLLAFGYYRHISGKYFGGITGDLAGWFVCICETAMLCAMALSGFFIA
ncbi:MAG: adenosylcobinamide-GDP ribazoletransferase [Stomatobaculum sp.]|nr:adenosylcobinamide-GDP ribazoletransferase [Stomatobaculum sp.]